VKRSSPRDRRAAQLLAAHAAGGLSPAEAAKVEAYLVAHPEARAELDEIGRLLDDVRAAQPRERDAEPDWNAMAREISAACDAAPPARSSWWRRLPARPVALATTGALAVVVAIAVLSRGDVPSRGNELSRGDETTRPGRETAATAPSPEAAQPDRAAAANAADEVMADEALAELRDPVLGDLSGEELERLERDLDREAAPEDAFVGELLAAGLSEAAPEFNDAAAERTGHAAESDLAFDDDAPAIDPFQPPDYLPIDEMADELPDEAIEAIDRFLAEAHAG
jgi:hypothetical protein